MGMNVDPELLTGFLDESQDSLNQVAALFVELEHDSSDRSLIDAIFRPIHSLKGNAAFFDLMEVKRLAHEMESLLDQLRRGQRPVERAVIDALLAGLDALQTMLETVRGGGSDRDLPGFAAILQDITLLLIDSKPDASLSEDAQLLRMLLSDAEEPLRKALERLIAAAGGPPPPPNHTGMPLTGRLVRLLDAAHDAPLQGEESEQVISMLLSLRQQCADPAALAHIDEAISGAQLLTQGLPLEAAAADFIRDQLRHIPGLPLPQENFASGEAAPQDHAPHDGSALEPSAVRQQPGQVAPAPAATPEKKPRVPAEGPGKSMRVSESTIDTFLHYVGELVVVGDMFRHLQSRVIGVPGQGYFARDLRRATETFASLANQLQTSIMSIRRVPLRPLLAKVPRLVRDISAELGKEIAVEILGDQVEVDKSLLELLDAPLTHMVRNAIDHGIEKPEIREASGKSRVGQVRLECSASAGSVVVQLSDDGAGLNLEGLRRKGESLGLVAPGAALEERQIIDLIFASGLSTAAKVTDISGRGVGMDVVKRAIEDAGGTISVEHKRGHGSTFTIRLPRGVTTQIVGGYLVQAGPCTYVLPLERVRETFQVRPQERVVVAQHHHCLQRRGQTLQQYDLAEILSGQALQWPERGLPVVVVESNRKPLALAVQAVLGVQKVVIRRLSGLPEGAPMVSGAALLGDGRLALVLDLDRLLEESAVVV